MKIKPVNEKVLLRSVPVEETIGGIVLPVSALEDSDAAEVIAVSDMISGWDLAVGDRVLVKKFAGSEIEWEGEKLRFVDVADLLAKYVEADDIPEN